MRILIRMLTCMLPAMIALVGATAGCVLLAFEADADAVLRSAAGQAPIEPLGFWRKPPNATEQMARWKDVPGVAATARAFIVTDYASDKRPAARVVVLTALLAAGPLDGAVWAELAAHLRTARLPQRAADAAYTMSLITARREPAIILARAAYAVRFWAVIEPNKREAALQALADIKPRLSKRILAPLVDALSATSLERRHEITQSLPSNLVADTGLMKLFRP